ncbi:MAG: DUF4976 domain-containing protein, partial [Planctomycetota bacterium]
RTERWKYIRYLDTQPPLEELYDLANDPMEENNLAPSPKYTGTLEKMRQRWQALQQQAK